MPLEITPAAPADDALYALYELDEAVDRGADLPLFTRPAHLAYHRHPPPAQEVRYGLARLDGELVGYTTLLFPQRDNLRTVEVGTVAVHPEHRRRGIGRALADFAVAEARRRGRSTLIGASARALPGGPARDPAGGAFARALGATCAQTEVRRRLDLTAAPDAAPAAAATRATTAPDSTAPDGLAPDGAIADGAAPDGARGGARAGSAGYSLVRWALRAPADCVDDVAYLDGRLLVDAPLGDLAWEPQRLDAARVRANEHRLAAALRRPYNVAARHDATGRLVAWTQILCADNADGHAWQQITIVDPAHRGHGLGLLVKVANLRYARAHEPGLRVVDTFNAAENGHMIAINERMGYRPLDAWENWQRTLD
ncbi:hypothetical protein GCM10010124_22700 [Pilimelia terevasa]|uniref:N-acetyltransferase domain-containing protein n=1 Tax=Pilimelia terevasa TaxID=53372 RepID=A0A8J3FIE5_9ACTN|nr:GNAT family N-acetyltransferase [Pilimelia terevasa]GGK29397.1 hypothetical protein GCM10010124_22700 [Pilimelia terevasa]